MTETGKKHVLFVAEKLFIDLFEQRFIDNGIDFTVVESQGNYDEIYSELNDNKYSGVVLTDNSLQPPMVAELIPELKIHYPAMPIYVLSVYTEHGLGEDYIKLGATDVFPIPVNVEELVKRLT